MACCLTAPSCHMNQSWLTMNEVLWYSFLGNVYLNIQNINPQVVFEIYTFEIPAIFVANESNSVGLRAVEHIEPSQCIKNLKANVSWPWSPGLCSLSRQRVVPCRRTARATLTRLRATWATRATELTTRTPPHMDKPTPAPPRATTTHTIETHNSYSFKGNQFYAINCCVVESGNIFDHRGRVQKLHWRKLNYNNH